jgi:hypothetical protein
MRNNSLAACAAKAALLLVAGTGLTVAVAAPAAAAETCGQASHVWLATPGGSLGDGGTVTVSVGNNVYATGVAQRDSRVTLHMRFPDGSVTGLPATTPADGNCVVHHETNTTTMPFHPTSIRVTADYTPWETGVVTSVFLGTITVV